MTTVNLNKYLNIIVFEKSSVWKMFTKLRCVGVNLRRFTFGVIDNLDVPKIAVQ